MAKALPSTRWDQKGPRIVHRKVILKAAGSAGSAAATHTLGLGFPGILRALSADYSATTPATADLVIKSDNVNGVTLFTKSNNATDIAAVFVTMPGSDEANGDIAETDAISGGLPFRAGLYFDLAQSDPNETVEIDVWVERCVYRAVDLYPVGADGSATATSEIRLGRPGIVRAIGVDYTTQPATADVTLHPDSASAGAIFTAANTGTDINPKPLASPAVDETGAATAIAAAATDAIGAGGLVPFKRSLFVKIAQGDAGATKHALVELWIDA